jgi:hypothetical protein
MVFMEHFFNSNNQQQQVIDIAPPSQEVVATEHSEKPEAVEFVPRFSHIQEDLLYLFTINITSEASLNYPWVKDEMYDKVVEELKHGTPFALDYMFEEKLLTKEELFTRGIQELKPYAKTILATYKGTRLTRAKNLFIDCGLLTEEETRIAYSA